MRRVLKLVFFASVVLMFSGCFADKEEGVKQFYEGMEYYNRGDYNTALKYFKESCDNEIPQACYNIGIIYEYKLKESFTKKDEILEAYQKSCELGYEQGCKKAEKFESWASIIETIFMFLGFMAIAFFFPKLVANVFDIDLNLINDLMNKKR